MGKSAAAMLDQANDPVIVGVEPQLFVTDIEASCAFFTEKLGFSVVFTYGEPPFYAQVARDGARLNLRHVDKPLVDAALVEREELLAATFTVVSADEIERLFDAYDDAEVHFLQRLAEKPWGARDFIVKDPDGNLLLFAGPAG